MCLKQLGGKPESCFARAGRTNDTAIKVSGVGGVLGSGVHGKKLRAGQYDVVLKLRVDKGLL